MSNPRGNPGNKGGGRKSAYQEKADAAMLNKLFFERLSQEEIETALRSGKFSIKDRFILTAMEGDTKVLTAIFNKLFPDKLEVEDETKLKIDV